MTNEATTAKKAVKQINVTYSETPLECPMPEDSKWDAHPKVVLPIESTGFAKCPYCGTEYILTDYDPNKPLGH